MPLCVLTHIPILSAAPKILNYSGDAMDRIIVANGSAVAEVLDKGNLKLVLQGHTSWIVSVCFGYFQVGHHSSLTSH